MVKDQLRRLLLTKQFDRQDWMGYVSGITDYMVRNSRAIREPNFRSICNEDLGLLFQVTDEQFFSGLLQTVVEQEALPLRFRLAKRMTSTGGMTTQQRWLDAAERQPKKPVAYEISIATNPLYKSFIDARRPKVGGLPCAHRLEALQRIMQHEMLHLAELLLWNDSNCAGPRFRAAARRLFGHRESNHQLLSPGEHSAAEYGIRTGQWVWFETDGQRLRGFVNRITKRATVLVPTRRGPRYDDGRCYLKFYVPLHRLSAAE